MAIDVDGPGVLTHLATLQGIIGRLSTLGGGIKVLAATIVSLVAVLGHGDWIVLLALGGFILTLWGLDGYYLAKERWFRREYNRFVDKLHAGKVLAEDLFRIRSTDLRNGEWLRAIASPSVWVFYISVLILSVVAVGMTGSL